MRTETTETKNKNMKIKIEKESTLRLNNCINGNPRYYIGYIDIPEHLHCHTGMTMYKGRRYGAGFVISSYNLQNSLDNMIIRALDSWLNAYLRESMDEKFNQFILEGLKTKYKTSKGYFRDHIKTVKSFEIEKYGIDYACESWLRGLGLDIVYTDYDIEFMGFDVADDYWHKAGKSLAIILNLN